MDPLVAVRIATALVVAGLMEPWAAFLHERVWHRALWFIHRSHHRKHHHRFEANDVFPILHAPIGIACIVWGAQEPATLARALAFGAGIGMAAFGIAYVLVHDGFVHGRLPLGFLARIPYFARLKAAHEAHHTGRDEVPFGLFLGMRELERRRAARSR